MSLFLVCTSYTGYGASGNDEVYLVRAESAEVALETMRKRFASSASDLGSVDVICAKPVAIDDDGVVSVVIEHY